MVNNEDRKWKKDADVEKNLSYHGRRRYWLLLPLAKTKMKLVCVFCFGKRAHLTDFLLCYGRRAHFQDILLQVCSYLFKFPVLMDI